MNGHVQSVKIYTTQFWLVCTSSLLFFASFNMIIPELPAYLTSLGGEEYKGLIISLFTITALASRPFSGRLADKLGRVPVMIFGSSVCFVIGLIYPVLTSISGFLFLRLVHGFSTGFTPTGQTAFLSDIIPAERRGEAMGILGTAGTIGMAAGPAIGGAIANNTSFNFLFYSSSAFALISILILTGIRETLPVKSKFNASMLRVERHDLFERRVIVPCVIMFFSVYAYGAVLTVMPDFGEYVGIKNKGLLFTFFTVASLTVRLIGGRASDKYGRRNVLLFSILFVVTAMIVIGVGSTPLHLMIGMSIYGLGHGMTSPTLLAWATDLSDPNHKGRGLASLYIFMELGIGVGAFASGLIFNNDPSRFLTTFLTCAALCTIGFTLLLMSKRLQWI